MSQSLNDKIHSAFGMANEVANRLEASGAVLDEETMDMVYGHADGLTGNWFFKRRDGRCSLQAMIDFDADEEETKLDTQLATLRKLLEHSEFYIRKDGRLDRRYDHCISHPTWPKGKGVNGRKGVDW